MKVLGYASRQHYADHIAPILAALPEEIRGGMYGPHDRQEWGAQIPRVARDVLWVVGSYVDAQVVPGRFVYVEHGAGQSYAGTEEGRGNASYAGGTGDDWKRCVLVICPGNVAAAAHIRERSCPVVAVGCPYLDGRYRGEWPGVAGRPTVTFAFHWDASAVCPEAGTALAHYKTALEGVVADLRSRGWVVWGHGHPRAQAQLKVLWAGLGVPWVGRGQVYRGADVLVSDNTSVMWEFASLGGKLVNLNAPWYRRGVDHGLRFWRFAHAGVLVDTPGAIVGAVALAMSDPIEVATVRRSAVRETYSYVDGSSSERAARAICEVTGDDWRSVPAEGVTT